MTTTVKNLLIDIPRAAEIDYNDTDEVYAYAKLLARLLESHGGLNVPRNNSAIVRVLDAEGLFWLTEVRRLLIEGSLSAIPDLLEAYIFLDSVCRGSSDTEFYNEVRLNAVKRWLGGEKALTETQIVLLLWPVVSYDPRNVDQRYARFCSCCLDSWITELRKFGRFNGITDAEAYQRLDYILNRNLFAFTAGDNDAERAVKLNWAQAYIVSDPSSLDTTTLRAYIPFAQTVSELRRPVADLSRTPADLTRTVDDLPRTPTNLKRTHFEASEAAYETLLEELSSRSDLHPLYRQAISLTLDNRHRLFSTLPEEIA